MEFRIFLVVFVCTFGVTFSVYCHEETQDPYRGYATKTPYREANVTEEWEYSSTRNDGQCTATRYWMLQRHGTRNAGADDIILINNRLPQILLDADWDRPDRDEYICDEDVAAFLAWDPQMPVLEQEELTQTGVQEHITAARRLSSVHYELLGNRGTVGGYGPYDASKYEFRHTDRTRTRDSARAFAQGLFNEWEDVELVVVPEEDDWLLRYYDNCDKYIEEVGDQPTVERDEFENGEEMQEVKEYIRQVLGLPEGYLTMDDVILMHTACVYEYGIYNDSAWCAVFPDDKAQVLEYYEDLEYYWEDGYGYNISHDQACVLINDIYEHFTSDSEQDVRLRFGHSANINTFLANLGLFRDDTDLLASNYAEMGDRQWRTSLHTTMASNIVFVKYECEGGKEDHIYFTVYSQEKVITLPDCVNNDPCELPISWWEKKTCDIFEVCEEEAPLDRLNKASSSLLSNLLVFAIVFQITFQLLN